MIEIILKKEVAGFEWVNITEPTLRELAKVALEYNLHSTSVHDCLEPEHLPKYEKIGDVAFIVARAFDNNAPMDSDTVRKLTNKVALFLGNDFIITIQRSDHEYLRVVRNKWRVAVNEEENIGFMVLVDIYKAVITTYEGPVNEADEALDRYEEQIFADNAPASIIERLYLLRRKTAVYKRLIFQTNEAFSKISSRFADDKPYMQDVIDKSNEIYYQAEQLHLSANDMLNIYLALASHRTNEVMRVLTIASVFFLPLTFIVGMYGMNFQFMPELEFKYAYFLVWVIMIAVVVGIYVGLRRMGWLRDNLPESKFKGRH